MKKLLLILGITSLCLTGVLLLPELITYTNTPPGVIVPGDIIPPADITAVPAGPAATPVNTGPEVIPGVIIAGPIIPPGDIVDDPPALATTPANAEPDVKPEVTIARDVIPPADIIDEPAAPAATPVKIEPDVIIAKAIIPPADIIDDPAAPAATPANAEEDVIPVVPTTQAKTINPDDLVQNWGPWARIAPAAGGYNPQFSQENRDYNILPELISYIYDQPGGIPGVIPGDTIPGVIVPGDIIPPGDIIDDPVDTPPYGENVRIREHRRLGKD